MLRTGHPYNGEEKGVACRDLRIERDKTSGIQHLEVSADRKGVMHEDKVCYKSLDP